MLDRITMQVGGHEDGLSAVTCAPSHAFAQMSRREVDELLGMGLTGSFPAADAAHSHLT